MATTNRYGVPKRQWSKWTEDGRAVFNELYCAMGDQRIFSHPKASAQLKDHWKTTRWNAAWIAAGAVSDRLKSDDHPANIATRTLAAVVLTNEGKRHKWTPQERRGYSRLVRQLGLTKKAA